MLLPLQLCLLLVLTIEGEHLALYSQRVHTSHKHITLKSLYPPADVEGFKKIHNQREHPAKITEKLKTFTCRLTIC